MAISTQKFLPGSGGTTKSVSQAKISSITLTSQDKKSVNTIRVRTIQIEHLLKGTLAADKKRLGDKKKDANTKRKEDLETNLEKKPDLKKKFTMPKILPRTGILDWIKNFITNILLGYFAVRLVEHLPALAGLFKGIVAVGEFIIDWGGRILNGLVTFVDWGYKLYDGLRQFTNDIFGESGLKKFDAFMKGLNTFINAVLILGLAIARVAPKFLGKDGKGVKGRNLGIKGTRGQAGRTTRGGTSSAAARRYTDKFGRRAAIKKFGKEGVQSLGGRYGRSGVTNLARKSVVKILGKGGVKAASRILRPIVKNIPIIGGLLEFAIAWASGDPIGKAAFRGIGAGLGTWVGGALGTLVGGPIGTGIGMFIGGAGGSELGGVMYDAWFGGKKSPRKSQGYAKGGRVKKASRTYRPRIKRRKKTRRAPYIPPIKIDPGKDVGGEKKLEESPWWNPFGLGRGEENLLDYFKKYGDKFGKLGYFGPMATLAIKALVGQKPSDKEYDDAALGLSALTASSALGFAAGGKVDRASLQKDFIKKEFKKSFIPLVDEVVSDIQKNLGKAKPKGEGGKKKEGASSTPGGQKGYMSGPAGTSGDKLTMARNLMRDLGLTEAQAAGIVGNMAAESGVENGRPQGSRPGVKAPLVVDGKTGYGLVQWTSRGRQQGLWDFAKSKGHDMSKPLTMDLEYQYFLKEFQGSYGHVLNAIRESKNVKEASTIFMQQYEIPAGYKTEAKIMERYNASEPIYQNLSSGKGTVTEGVGEFIPSKDGESYNKDIESNVGGSSIVEIGKSLAQQGFSIDEHPDFVKSKAGGIGQYSPGKGRVTNVHKGAGHYDHRALDVTNWGGGSSYRKTYIPVLDSLQQNSNIKMLIHDSWGFYKNGKKSGPGNYGHDTHMHIETYHKGGKVHGSGERWAKLLGGEMVIDIDSAGPAKDLLLAINQASGRDGVMKAIKDYAPYEAIQSRMIPVPVERMVPVPIPSTSGGVVVIGGGGGSDPFSSLALNA